MTRITFAAMSLVIGFCLSIVGQIAMDQEPSCPSPPRASFRYLVARNQIFESVRYPEGGSLRVRSIDILLDSKSFSESTLRKLIELISKRFPDPETLFVNIYTNLDDVATPEEAECIETPNIRFEFPNPKYAWAFYVRNSENERLDYNTQLPGDVFRSVLLRGKKQ